MATCTCRRGVILLRACRATTICIVEQLGLAMIFLGVTRASVGFTSGTTRGTSSAIRKALELSIISAPWRVITSAYLREVSPPAETKAISTSRNASLSCNSSTLHSCLATLYSLPALREEPKRRISAAGKLRCSIRRINSPPTAPEAPTIAIFIPIFL